MDSTNPFAHSNAASPSEKDKRFEREYDRLFGIQTQLKEHLAKLYIEHRRLCAKYNKIPESQITNEDIDVRSNKDAPKMENLLPVGSSGDGKPPKDERTLNRLRILGAIDIDINSLDDECEELERRNERIKNALRASEQEEKARPTVVDMGDEVMETVVESQVREMERIRERAKKLEASIEDPGFGAELSRQADKKEDAEKMDEGS